MKLHRAPHEAIVVQSGGPIYQGHAGQTRTERVHLVELDGSVRSVEVHREPRGGRYQQVTVFRKGDRIALLLLPDVSVAVEDILP